MTNPVPDATGQIIPGPAGPVSGAERIEAIDVARGLALLGIFFVNIATFSQPFGNFVELAPRDLGPADKVVHYFTKIFCEGKFYPLFSTLFGVGLTLQFQRARAAGAGATARGFRRLGMLALIGALHAVLLWYGDILFIYALMGLLLLVVRPWSAKVLAILAGVILLVVVVLGTGFTAITNAEPEPGASIEAPAAASPAQPAAPADPPAIGSGPFMRLIHAFKTGQDLTHDPSGREIPPMSHPLWLDAETEAYRDGPYFDATMFRVLTWLIILIVTFFSFGWMIAAMFLIGAVLVKLDAFAPRRLHWHRRMAVVGLGLGIPLATLGALGPELMGQSLRAILVYTPPAIVASPLVALGYLGLVRVLVARGVARGLCRALACAGRMALTCYLLETVLATVVFYHYGLARFAALSRAECAGVVVVIYACLVLLSVAWLKRFRFGPMEWLWRSFTYLEPQAMRARQDASG